MNDTKTSTLARLGRRYPVGCFYVLTFGISWAGFAPLLAAQWGVRGLGSRLWLGGLVLPCFGPAVAAGWVARMTGEAGTAWGRLWAAFSRRVGWVWWVTAGLMPVSFFLVANGLSRWIRFGTEVGSAPGTMGAVLFAVGFAVVANPWEEVGWRGFALRRLEGWMHPAGAALVVGVLWAAWHLPLLLWAGSPMSRYPMMLWGLGVVGRSYCMTWLWNRTAGSLGVVTLFHVAMNVSGAVLGVRSEGMLGLVCAGAAVVTVAAAGTGLGHGVRYPADWDTSA